MVLLTQLALGKSQPASILVSKDTSLYVSVSCLVPEFHEQSNLLLFCVMLLVTQPQRLCSPVLRWMTSSVAALRVSATGGQREERGMELRPGTDLHSQLLGAVALNHLY